MILRLLSALPGAVAITLALFGFMQTMIHIERDGIPPEEDYPVIDFIRLRQQATPNPERQRRRPPNKPPRLRKPPPSPAPQAHQTVRRVISQIVPRAPKLDLPIHLEGPDLQGIVVAPQAPSATMQQDVMPLFRVPPRYPLRAARKGIEGWVRVHFVITETGTVKDVQVLAAEPSGIFEQAAIRAILQWRFKPKVVGGKKVPRPAIQLLEFKLRS